MAATRSRERRVPCRPVKVFLVCPLCGTDMVAMGIGHPTSPPKYPHQCDNCGNVITVSGKVYPHIEYECDEDG